MESGQLRRSGRISELEAKKAKQAERKKEKNKADKLAGAKATGTQLVPERNWCRKRKTGPVHVLGGTSSGQVHNANAGNQAADISSGLSPVPPPNKEKLMLILDKLKLKDSYGIFAAPVDPNEVEDYYDVIKDPMDFSTIAKKIDGGSYKIMAEFEHDLYLVYNNAMVFNAPNTIYYKQAIAIRDLVQKLLVVLKTDPEKLKPECGKKRLKNDGKIKDDAECSNAPNETTGYSTDEELDDSLPLRRYTYTPHTSFGNESFMSQVLKSSRKLELENQFGYSQSLMRFAKDLGPTAQMVALRKLQGGVAETSTRRIAASNFHRQTPSNQIHAVTSALQGINTAQSSTFLGNSAGRQIFSGGISEAGCTMKAHGDVSGKFIQAPKNQIPTAVSVQKGIRVAPSLRFPILSGSAGPYDFHGNSMNISNTLSRGIPKLTDEVVFSGSNTQKLVPEIHSCPSSSWQWPSHPMTGGSSRGEAIGFMHEVNSHHLGGAHPQVLAHGEGPNIGDNIWQGGLVSDRLKLNVPEGSSSTQANGSIQGLGSHYGGQISNWFNPTELGLESISDPAGQSHGGNEKHEGKISSWFKPTEMGMEPVPDAAGPNLGGNVSGGQISSWEPTGMDLVLIPEAAGPSHGCELNHGGQLSNWSKPTEPRPEPISNDWLQEQCGSLPKINVRSCGALVAGRLGYRSL